MKHYSLLLVFLLSACTSTPQSDASRTSNERKSPESQPTESAVPKPQVSAPQALGSKATESRAKLPTNKAVYGLQHVLIPQWTFFSDGNFYDELQAGKSEKLKQIAGDLLSTEYAEGIKVEPLHDQSAVLIVFPTPTQLTECFFVLIVKKDQQFALYTYEKTLNLEGLEGINGVVGGWSKQKQHLNFGPRAYTSAADFVADVLASGK